MVSKQLKLENQICHSLYSATNALVRAYRPLLDALNLTYPQYLVMLALWEADQVAIKDLVQRTRLDAGTLTPILKRLEAKGVLQLTKSEQDSRHKVVALTKSGGELASRAECIPESLACQCQMTMEEGQALKNLAEKLYSSFS